MWLAGSCASQEFTGDSAIRQPIKTPPKPPPSTDVPGTGTPGTPGNPGSPGGPMTDDGTVISNLPGTPVAKVGIGFEDRTDNDFNDIYLCFQGHFNVNGRDIVSNREQTIQAIWGNRAAIAHYVTITITAADGRQLFNQGYQGRSGKDMGSIPLTFTKGSRLSVQIRHNSTQHTNENRARVDLDRCNNTGG